MIPADHTLTHSLKSNIFEHFLKTARQFFPIFQFELENPLEYANTLVLTNFDPQNPRLEIKILLRQPLLKNSVRNRSMGL